MMWANPMLFAGALVVGGIIALATAFINNRNRYQDYQERPGPNLGPDPDRIVGSCGMCDGGVTILNGYRMPCNHYFHFTCANAISLEYGNSVFNWSDVCKMCVRARINDNLNSRRNNGFRHRRMPEPNQQNCADCGCGIGEKDDSQFLDCNRHRVHQACWAAMEASGLTTCSMCMEEQSVAE